MANPFEDTLDEVVTYTGSTLVSLDTLNTLSTFLANQEDKVKALSAGLAQSLMGHYDKAKGNKKLDAVRTAIVDMLTSLALLSKGRIILLKTPIGRDRLLKLLNDGSASVRKAACTLFSTFAVFPDVHHVLLQGRVVMNAMIRVLLKDELSVAKETIPGLAQLSMKDTETSEPTMKRLLFLLQEEEALRQGVLQTIWNCCTEDKEKKLAISCGAIPILASFLKSKDNNIKRLTTGCLMAISVAENGKAGLIDEEGAILSLVNYNLNKNTPADLTMNSRETIRNIAEHPRGLTKSGNYLVHDPQVLLEILSEEQVASVLNPLLSVENQIAPALTALRLLCKSPSGRQAAWSILEVIPRLHAITIEQQSPQVRGMASKVIDDLCSDNENAKALFDSIPKERDEEYIQTANSTITPTETAILLVQYQNDYLNMKGVLNDKVKDAAEETQILWHTVDLIERARKLGVMIVHLPLSFKDEGSYENGPLKDMADTGAFQPGSWGAGIVDEMQPQDGDIVSPTSGLSAFVGTDLESTLRSKGINDVVVCGLLGDGAVESTMRTAYDIGFRVFAVDDCTASYSLEKQKIMMANSLSAFGLCVNYKKLLALLTSDGGGL